jgi:hypothetical protein
VAHSEWRRKPAWAPRSSISCAQKNKNFAGNGLSATIKYLRRTASGGAGNGLGATIKYYRRSTSGTAGNGLSR